MSLPAEILDDRASWLSGREADVHSQFGEDGLIAACLEHFGETNRWCFEVGASDGLFFSNTRRLILDGWHAVLIEKADVEFEKMVELYRALQSDNNGQVVHCIHREITQRSIDDTLESCGAPHSMDFGVIDIDGMDYWVFKGMERYKPRIMLVEFHNRVGCEDFIPQSDGSNGAEQAGVNTIKQLGEDKGYTAIAMTHVNLLFCRSDLLDEQ